MRNTICRWTVLVILVLAATATAEPPPVFSDASYEEARAKAEAEGKAFLVDATAVWCMPCKQMDQTTWINPAVVGWIEQHAVAAQVDVDQRRDVAGALRIQAMPTVILFKKGEEFDRVVGFKTAEQLLRWLDGTLEGRRSIDAIRERAGGRGDAGGRVDVQARLELAGSLVERGEYEAAAEEYAWLWDNMLEHQPSMSGVRVSFMIGDMQRLVQQAPSVRPVFVALRDRIEQEVGETTPHWRHVVDWVRLNGVIGDGDRTLAWFDSARNDPAERELFRYVERDLIELLEARRRFADAGTLYEDPVDEVRRRLDQQRQIAELEMNDPRMDEAMRGRVRESQLRSFRQWVGKLYACCLAAARDADAAGIVALLESHEDVEGIRDVMATQAYLIGVPRAEHVDWALKPSMRDRIQRKIESMEADAPQARTLTREMVAAMSDAEARDCLEQATAARDAARAVGDEVEAQRQKKNVGLLLDRIMRRPGATIELARGEDLEPLTPAMVEQMTMDEAEQHLRRVAQARGQADDDSDMARRLSREFRMLHERMFDLVPQNGLVTLELNDVAVDEMMPFMVGQSGKWPVFAGDIRHHRITLLEAEPITREDALDRMLEALEADGLRVVETADEIRISPGPQAGGLRPDVPRMSRAEAQVRLQQVAMERTRAMHDGDEARSLELKHEWRLLVNRIKSQPVGAAAVWANDRGDDPVILAFNNVAVIEVVPYLVQSTSKPVNIEPDTMQHRFSLHSDDPISRDAAFERILKKLRADGLIVEERVDEIRIQWRIEADPHGRLTPDEVSRMSRAEAQERLRQVAMMRAEAKHAGDGARSLQLKRDWRLLLDRIKAGPPAPGPDALRGGDFPRLTPATIAGMTIGEALQRLSLVARARTTARAEGDRAMARVLNHELEMLLEHIGEQKSDTKIRIAFDDVEIELLEPFLIRHTTKLIEIDEDVRHRRFSLRSDDPMAPAVAVQHLLDALRDEGLTVVEATDEIRISRQ